MGVRLHFNNLSPSLPLVVSRCAPPPGDFAQKRIVVRNMVVSPTIFTGITNSIVCSRGFSSHALPFEAPSQAWAKKSTSCRHRIGAKVTLRGHPCKYISFSDESFSDPHGKI